MFGSSLKLIMEAEAEAEAIRVGRHSSIYIQHLHHLFESSVIMLKFFRWELALCSTN